MTRNLQIVTLNIPYPPDYGGMIDTFYRIRSLHDLGVRIHLHCFEYGRQHSKEVESLCETTSYYPRKSGLIRQFSTIPYIVSSRKSKILLDSLIRNDYPILFDGLHSTFYIDHPAFSCRKKLVRLHNIEHKYYHVLADSESNLLKKTYFLLESAKLRTYEKVLDKADYILPISASDQEYFNSKYHNAVFLAPSHPFNESKSLAGIGKYLIYHGDLSVNENSVIANSLISNVFSKIPFDCVIAGKDPSETLTLRASKFKNINIISNPDIDQMENLIVNAQINLLPSLTTNGFKLKLLMALYAGRHLLVNSVIAEYASIKNFCHVTGSYEEMVNKIYRLMEEPFTEEMKAERYKVLSENFDVKKNAEKLVELIF
jgi:glycosyltransferase involved in cell wall biosynthesis